MCREKRTGKGGQARLQESFEVCTQVPGPARSQFSLRCPPPLHCPRARQHALSDICYEAAKRQDAARFWGTLELPLQPQTHNDYHSPQTECATLATLQQRAEGAQGERKNQLPINSPTPSSCIFFLALSMHSASVLSLEPWEVPLLPAQQCCPPTPCSLHSHSLGSAFTSSLLMKSAPAPQDCNPMHPALLACLQGLHIFLFFLSPVT